MDESEPHSIIRNRTAFQLFMLHSFTADEDYVDIDESKKNKIKLSEISAGE